MTFQRARSEEQRELRRRAILDAAAAMLTEMPVAEVTLNELSRRAGLAKSNVLRYFESREAILLELLDRAAKLWLSELPEQLAAGMEAWNAEVKATVPAEKLLVWDPADGWEPLCDFLEVAVPEGEVPRVNDTAAFIEGMLGGGLAKLNAWWEERERSASGLHGAPA